jgi:hypothetical protein
MVRLGFILARLVFRCSLCPSRFLRQADPLTGRRSICHEFPPRQRIVIDWFCFLRDSAIHRPKLGHIQKFM